MPFECGHSLANGMVPSHTKTQDLSKSGIDFQKIADSANWGWEDDKAGPFWGISQAGEKYSIVMISKPNERYSLTFKVLHGEKELYSWQGRNKTVFRIQEDRLYYTQYSSIASGGSVVAVNLSTTFSSSYDALKHENRQFALHFLRSRSLAVHVTLSDALKQ